MTKRTYLVFPLLALALGVGACAPVKGAGPAACPIPSAQEMVDAVNADRAMHGLELVALADNLSQRAHTWAVNLASVEVLYHSPDPHHFRERGMEGENVLGPSFGCLDATQMEALWMASSGHRDAIMKSQWETFGFGVAVDSQGRLWAVQEFGI